MLTAHWNKQLLRLQYCYEAPGFGHGGSLLVVCVFLVCGGGCVYVCVRVRVRVRVV